MARPDRKKCQSVEVTAIDEAACLEAAECGADHRLGTLYYDSVHTVARQAGMEYAPLYSLAPDTTLCGTIPEIAGRAATLEALDVDDTAVTPFRYAYGDSAGLRDVLVPILQKPFYISGSVDSYTKIDIIRRTPKLTGFTIGGAFLEQKFGGIFSQQIAAVDAYLK